MSRSLDRDRMRPARRGVLLCGAGAMALGLAAAGAASAGGSLPVPTNTGGWANASASTSGATETVTVTSSRAYAEWSAFNLSSGNTLAVSGQTGANWILVNKVTGGTGTVIGGAVNALGQVWIIDPNGVTVNAGAAFNVGGLLLSSAAWSAADKSNFLAGGASWSFTGATQPIVLNGVVNASGGGVVALLGPSVIVGPTGAVSGGANTQVLAVAAKDVSLSFGDNGTYFTLDGVTIQRGADGGQVQISSGASISADRIVVASAGETSAASIVVAGGLTANAARADGSDIVLLAADGTGPDATPTAQTVVSNGAVPSWSAGASATQGAATLQTGAALQAAGVSIAAGGDISLGGDITATGQASLYSSTGAITQAAGVVATPLLTGSAATSITMPDANLVGALSSFSAGGGLSFVDAQGLTVSGVGGGTGGLSLTVAAGALTLNGNLTAGGTVSFGGPVALGTDTTVSGSAVTFGSTLDGAHRLTVVSAGTTTFGGAVGAGTALASLSVSGKSALDGGRIGTSGAQTFTGAVSLGANTALAGSSVTFGSTVDGSRILAIQGNAVLDGAVGASTRLASLSVSGTSALNGGSVKTTGSQTYTGAAALDANTTLTGTTVTFGSTLDGGPVKPVGVVASGDGATLGGSTSLAGPTPTFGSTLSSVYSLAVNGTAVFSGAVGSTTQLASLSVSGTTVLAGGPVKTKGAQTYKGAATLGADAALAGSTVSFGSTVDGGFGLTVNAAGAAGFGGAVGGGAPLASLAVSAGSITLAAPVQTSGALSLTSGAGLTVPARLASSAGDVTLASGGDLALAADVDAGAGTLTLTASGAVTQTSGVLTAQILSGSSAGGASLTQANRIGAIGSFTTTADGAGFTLSNAQALSVTGPVTAGLAGRGDLSLTTTAGDLTLAGDLTASGGGTVSITSAGAIRQTGGTITAGTLTGSAGASATLDQANAVGSLSGFTASTGLSFVGGVGFAASGVQGGSSLSLTASTGDLTLAGDVGATTVVLSASSGGISQSGGVITAGTLGGSAATSVLLGDANLVQALSSFTAKTGLSFVDAEGFTAGGVAGGSSTTLAASAGDLTLSGDVNGTAVSLTAAQGAIAQTGGVVTAGTLTGSARTSVALGDGNAVGILSGFTANSGLVFTNAAGFTAQGVDGGTATHLTASTGGLTLAGDIGGTTVALSAPGGAITQTGGIITATTLTGSAGTRAVLDDANAVQRLSGFTATAGFGFANAAGFTASGVSGGTSVNLTASAGDLTLSGNVGGSTTALTATAGAIVQTGGIVTADTLSGSAGTSASLADANAVGALSGFSTGAGLVFVNGAGFSAAGVAGGSSTRLTASTGDLTLSGDVSGTTTRLTALAGSIAQTGGVVSATTLSGSAAGSAALNDANAVGTLSGFTAGAGLSFTNAAGFTAENVQGGTSASLTAGTGDLTLSGDVSAGAVTLTAATGAVRQTGGTITATTLSGAAGTSAVLDDANAVGTLSGFSATAGLSFVDAAGFTAEGVAGGTSTSLTAGAGDLTLAGDVSGATTTLTAPDAILQTGGVVTAGTLTGSAGTRISLADANAVGSLSDLKAPGGIVFVNGAGFTATGVDGGTSTSLTAGTGDLVLAGDVSGTTTNLSALTGSISQSGGIVAAATLTGSAGGGASLTQANAVQTLSGFTAATGLRFVDAGGFSAASVDGGASTSLTAGAGQLTLSGDVSGTRVALTASGGAIVQTGGTLTAGTLTGTSFGAASLTDANLVGTLGGFTTYGPGADFTLVNAQTLTVTGPLTAGATAPGGAAGVAEGNLSLTVTAGRLNLDGDLIATADASGTGGEVVLASAGGIASGDPPAITAQDISISSQSGSVSLGDLTATRDIAVSSATGSVAIDAASAGGNIVLRAPGDITVAGGLSATGSAASAGPAQALFASDPTMLGGVAFTLAGSNVDLKAGGLIQVGGPTTAVTDARFQAGGAVGLGAVAAGQDVVVEGASLEAGALSASSGDVALQTSGAVQIASASAGDAVVVDAGGAVSVSGPLTAAGAGTGDSRPRAGDVLADTVLGLKPGQITGDVVITGTDVQLGHVSAANGDVLMFARPSGAASVTYLGGSGGGQGGFHLDAVEISGITAHSLDIFAGLTAAGSGDVSIGALNLPQSLPTLRVYTGGAASRVDVFGPVTGAAGSSLVIGDTQLRSELNPPSATVLALSQGWTPKVIRVEGTIGGLGAGQAFDQVSLSAQSLYIAPVEPGLNFEAAVRTVRPESLPAYTGPMTWQIAAANLQLSAAGPGVIYERNLARNASNLADGVGLSVGRITIATIAPSNAPPSQIALFGTLDPHGKLLNGLTAALSLTFPSQAGVNAPVRFTPNPALIDRYKFSTCAFGGGDCFINIPPLVVPTVPVPNQIGDLSDPFAPTDEEPVTSSGGEITWPSVSGGDHHP